MQVHSVIGDYPPVAPLAPHFPAVEVLIWEVDWLALDVLLAGEADFEEEVLEVFGSATAFAGEGVALTEVVEDARVRYFKDKRWAI